MMDVVVCGAGIWGCTVARRLAESGRQVLVVEKRANIGGNCRCEIDSDSGIEVHSYGCHIFHTHNKKVWRFANRFTEFNGYQHKVYTTYRGKVYPLPLGLGLINKFFNVELKPNQVCSFLKEEDRSKKIFDAFFRGYTCKQWGKVAEEVDPDIIKRIPIRENYDLNYYHDCLQGIPSEGYNEFFERIIDHPNIRVECNHEFDISEIRPNIRYFYSGPIDSLFKYKYGALPWRTLKFETEKLNVRDFQGTSQMNYADVTIPYTRILEFKHFHPEGRFLEPKHDWGFACDQTIITREYPMNWKVGDEPYYPVNNRESDALLSFYKEEALKIRNLVIGGRLGEFRYYDMDQALASALEVAL